MQQRQTQEEAQKLIQRQGVITDLQTTLGKFEHDLYACIRNSLDSSINTHLNYMKKEDAYVALFSMLYTAKKETIANLIKEIMPDSAKQIVSTITRQTEQDTFQRSIADYLRTNKWRQRRRKSLLLDQLDHSSSQFDIPPRAVKKSLAMLPAIKTTSPSITSKTSKTTKPPFTTSTKSRLPPLKP
jgi:sorbitol-specific phosphotransferase system component IIBC